jgi:hypothetical protein
LRFGVTSKHPLFLDLNLSRDGVVAGTKKNRIANEAESEGQGPAGDQFSRSSERGLMEWMASAPGIKVLAAG